MFTLPFLHQRQGSSTPDTKPVQLTAHTIVLRSHPNPLFALTKGYSRQHKPHSLFTVVTTCMMPYFNVLSIFAWEVFSYSRRIQGATNVMADFRSLHQHHIKHTIPLFALTNRQGSQHQHHNLCTVVIWSLSTCLMPCLVFHFLDNMTPQFL